MSEHRATDQSMDLRALAYVALELLGRTEPWADRSGLVSPGYFGPDVSESMLRALLRHAVPELLKAGHSTLARDIQAALEASDPLDGG